MHRPFDRPAKPPRPRVPARAGLHPRNRHQGRYDFTRLTSACPELSTFVIATPGGERSIDFSDPVAVRALNRALLKTDYGIEHWDLPAGYLCPPIPGRADYLHGLADLLAESNDGIIPRGAKVHALDVGTGASIIYPLLGHSEYGWRFIGSDIDNTALQAAAVIVHANSLDKAIGLRRQGERTRLFEGLVHSDDMFDVSLCNPPFHLSAEDAALGSQRKWRNLGKRIAPATAPRLNFGGHANELWCPGGEIAFVKRMIRESATIPGQVLWFSSLIAKSEHLAEVRKALQQAGVQDVREVAMAQGNKQSRFVAWTFLDSAARDTWRATRWHRPA